METNKIIEVSSETRQKLMSAFGVTGKTVSNALRYDQHRGHTSLASRIRVMALELGGRMMVTSPVMDTIHTSNHEMLQEFANGAEIRVDMRTGTAVLRDSHGVVRAQQHDITIPELYAMQERASHL